jgi:hypothetical protein
MEVSPTESASSIRSITHLSHAPEPFSPDYNYRLRESRRINFC